MLHVFPSVLSGMASRTVLMTRGARGRRFHRRSYGSFVAKPKSFNDVPSMTSLPIFGHSYLFNKNGPYNIEKLTDAVIDISRILGPVFRLNLGGGAMLVTLDADHAETMYRYEGKHPYRPSFPALAHHRKHAYNSIGIVPGNGEEWYKFRTGLTPLLKPEVLKSYNEQIQTSVQHFIEHVERVKSNDYVLEDVYQHLMLFTIEAISCICPGVRYECLSGKEGEKAVRIVSASKDFMDGMYATMFSMPTWKMFRSAGYQKLETSHKTIHRIILADLESQRSIYENNPNQLKVANPFIYQLFSNERLSWDDQVMLGMETFLAGIDTTATTVAFTLYYLCKHQKLQEEARCDESGDFIKACIKETLRLRSTALANSRILSRDVEFDGYMVPKGTVISSFLSAMAHRPLYFRNSYEYIPQRWSRTERHKIHPFAALPFGHGARVCPGKRLAVDEMTCLLQTILRNYKLDLINPEDVGMVVRMNRVPDRPINIKFSPIVNTNC